MARLKPRELLIIALLLLFLTVFFYGLGGALLPLLFSTFLAYASLPLVKYFDKKGLHRWMSTTLVLGVVSLVFTLALVLGLPPLIEDIREALIHLPGKIFWVLEQLNTLLQDFGISLPYSRETLEQYTEKYSESLPTDVLQYVGNFLRNSLASATSVIVVLLNVFLIPIFYVYVINDFERMLRSFIDWVPPKHRPDAYRFIRECDRILSGFIRGQLLVCAILALIYSTGLLIVGLKFALLIGFLTGLLSFIPYVGFSIGFLAAIITALSQGSTEGSYGIVVGVMIAYGIGQFLESYFITPRIVGNKVGLTPFEAILALIVFGNLLGFMGLFVAIPVGAIAKLLFDKLLDKYKKSSFYT